MSSFDPGLEEDLLPVASASPLCPGKLTLGGTWEHTGPVGNISREKGPSHAWKTHKEDGGVIATS